MLEGALHDGQVDVLLRLEVEVDAALAGAGLGGHVLDGCALVAETPEPGLGGVEEAVGGIEGGCLNGCHGLDTTQVDAN